MELTQTELIGAALSDPARAPMSMERIISEEIREFKASEQYREMLEAGRYYRNRSDVQRKKNDIEQRSNTRIEHPAYKRMVDQKVRFLLSRPWAVSTKDKRYGEALGALFDTAFRRKIRRLGKGAVEDGIAWLQPYIGDGKLRFMLIPGTEVVPLWADGEKADLNGFIRFYEQVVYVGQTRTTVGRAEYWYEGGVRRFEDAQNSGQYRELLWEGSGEAEPHFTLGEMAYNWSSVPIVWLRYNDEDLPLLRYNKELIDDYNWQTSVTADVLRDVAKFVYVLKNYGGADLAQFISELRSQLAIQVDGDGGVDKLQADINVDAVMAFMDKQRRDMYDFSSAVDTKDPELGNASGKAIGFRYMDLDADCTDLGAELSATFGRLKPFIDTYFQASGLGDFSGVEFEVAFNKDMPIDESEIIANINASTELLSKRTLLENHPWVKDVEKELAAKEQERSKELELFGQGLFEGVTTGADHGEK